VFNFKFESCGLFFTQIQNRDTAKDVYLLSLYLKEIQDVKSYMSILIFIKSLCEMNSTVLYYFGLDITFHEDLINIYGLC